MANPPKSVSVEVDADVAKRVDEELAAWMKGLRGAADKETETMQAAEMQAAIQAAEKKAADAVAQVVALKTQGDATLQAVKDLTTALKTEADTKKAEADSLLDAQAKRVTIKRAGGDEKAATPEALTKMRAIGKAGLDELEALLNSPGRAAPKVSLIEPVKTGKGDDSGISKLRDGSFAVSDWSKFPAQGAAMKANPMGVRGVSA